VATVTALYLANWPAMVAGALVGYRIDRSHGERLEWDGLGGLIYGAFAGLVVVHMLWAVATWRLLRPLSPRSDVAIVVALVPFLIVATVIVLASSRIDGDPLVGWMVLASAVYPAAVTASMTDRWGTEPGPSLEPGAG
jgi:hypothetical protein